MMMMKTVRVEYHPLGVIGAIVPWNYPFHNVLNPIIASLFAGNGIVIKVSEYASWSTRYYGAVLRAVLVRRPKALRGDRADNSLHDHIGPDSLSCGVSTAATFALVLHEEDDGEDEARDEHVLDVVPGQPS